VKRLLGVVAFALVAAPGPAAASDRQVSMLRNVYSPSHLVAITGDRVTWTNSDFSQHNVNGDGFASPNLLRGETYQHTFASAGTFPYRCTVHLGMRGTVSVYPVYLSAPAGPAAYGRSVVVRGLAPDGSSVEIRRVSDGTTVATASAGAQGSFTATLAAPLPGQYVAVASGATSPAVRVAIRPRLSIRTRRSGGVTVVTLSATPSQSGASVVLERARGSGWARLAGSRLNAASQATFRVRATASMRVRARLVRGVGGYAPTTSAVVSVRR
jgi:plastocyanin